MFKNNPYARLALRSGLVAGGAFLAVLQASDHVDRGVIWGACVAAAYAAANLLFPQVNAAVGRK